MSLVTKQRVKREESWCAKRGVSFAANMQTKYVATDD